MKSISSNNLLQINASVEELQGTLYQLALYELYEKKTNLLIKEIANFFNRLSEIYQPEEVDSLLLTFRKTVQTLNIEQTVEGEFKVRALWQ